MRTAHFPVPMDVQELMSVRTPWLTFKFLDPVECLFRLLTAGPLSADMANMAFRPRLQHPWYAYYCGNLGFTVFLLCSLFTMHFPLLVKVRGFRRRRSSEKNLRCFTTGLVCPHRRVILRFHQPGQKRLLNL